MQAFKAVASVWLLTRARVARLAGLLTALHVAYFGMVWHLTHDLSTPMVAAFVVLFTEVALVGGQKGGGGGGCCCFCQ